MLDNRGSYGVGLQRALALPSCGLVGIGVVVLDKPVPVSRDAARVPALPRRGLEALTGLHHQLVVVAAGDPDVDVSEDDRAEGFLQRLVGTAEPHACCPKVVLHAEGDRGIARQPRALLRWLKPGRGGPIRAGRYYMARASSAKASARRAAEGTSVPRS